MRSHQRPNEKPAPAPVKKAFRQKLTFGDPVLNRLLHGGIPCGLITELAGEAAAGKSQACLQLLLNAQLPLDQGGFDGSALYIYTEGNASLARLQQLVDARGWNRDPQVMQQIIVKQGPELVDGEALLNALREAQPLLANRSGKRIRLIVVDSIAAVFRDVGDNPGVRQYAHRSGQLVQVASLLRRYAEEHSLAVVVTNQVTDVFKDASDAALRQSCATAGLDLWTSGRRVLPALGLAWARCLNQRLFLGRTQAGDGLGGVLRQARVVFSPYLPQRDCYYRVEQGGLRGLRPEDVRHLEGVAGGSNTSTDAAAAAAAQHVSSQPAPCPRTAGGSSATGEARPAAGQFGASAPDMDAAAVDDAAAGAACGQMGGAVAKGPTADRTATAGAWAHSRVHAGGLWQSHGCCKRSLAGATT